MAPRTMSSSNKSRELFRKINNYTFVVGLLNLWDEERLLPAIPKTTCYKLLFRLLDLLVYMLMVLQFSAFYCLGTFDEKQAVVWIMFTFSHPLLYGFYLNVHYYKNKVQDLLHCMIVQLKDAYNDKTVEKRMIRRAKIYMAAYMLLCCLSLAMYGFEGLIQVIRLDKSFTTIIVFWPDAEDKSTLSAIARVAIYIIWWVLVLRSTNAYVLAISSTICLSHQFKNLQSYFYKLNDIFKDNDLSQKENEEKYEKAFKVGIALHSKTLWCSGQCQVVYGLGYSNQTLISLTGLAILMVQMVSTERTVFDTLAIIATATTILLTTGIFMWNAGDVTVEALNLATAMYSSGWQHCGRWSSVRVRKLVTMAMTQAQKPVIIRAFGIMELSYGSYLSIVKSSYSVFSVIY